MRVGQDTYAVPAPSLPVGQDTYAVAYVGQDTYAGRAGHVCGVCL
jgi:hypothetical protein